MLTMLRKAVGFWSNCCSHEKDTRSSLLEIGGQVHTELEHSQSECSWHLHITPPHTVSDKKLGNEAMV